MNLCDDEIKHLVCGNCNSKLQVKALDYAECSCKGSDYEFNTNLFYFCLNKNFGMEFNLKENKCMLFNNDMPLENLLSINIDNKTIDYIIKYFEKHIPIL